MGNGRIRPYTESTTANTNPQPHTQTVTTDLSSSIHALRATQAPSAKKQWHSQEYARRVSMYVVSSIRSADLLIGLFFFSYTSNLAIFIT